MFNATSPGAAPWSKSERFSIAAVMVGVVAVVVVVVVVEVVAVVPVVAVIVVVAVSRKLLSSKS